MGRWDAGPALALVLAVGLATALALAAGAASASATAGAASTAGTATTQQQSLALEYAVSLTPERPGEVRVHAQLDVPDDVTSLSVTPSPDAAVVATDGFVRRSASTYEWNRRTQHPSLTYRIPVNETATGGEGGGRTGYFFVDAGEWAIARAPRLDLTYSGYGERPPVERDVAVDGAGVAGSSLVYLGPSESYTRRAAGQRFRLVVPAAADMTERPRAVLDSLASAATALDVGDRDARVLAVAAPTTIGWGSTGLQLGERDFWVRDVQRLGSPNNVWLHEYVHTRQDYRTTSATRWTIEGFAEYYAALLTLRQGRIDYDTFRDHLARGADAPYGDAVLADPPTWTAGANYWKGALVAGAMDYRIRRAGDASLDGAFRRMNDARPLDQSAFLAAVRSAGDAGVRSFAETHTETDATPETWSRATHVSAFGGLSAFAYELVDYRVTGPYREETFERPPTLVPGETLHVRVRVTNSGEDAGDYEARLTADGATVGVERGELQPGQSATLTFPWSADATGATRLRLADAETTVRVREPASPEVEHVRAPGTVPPDAAFAVGASVVNPADRPARGEVVVRADDRVVTRETVTLSPGGRTTVRATVRFESGGTHTISAGGERATVRVVEGATTAPASVTPATVADGSADSEAGGTPTVGTGGGFGVPAVVVAVVSLWIGGRRWRS